MKRIFVETDTYAGNDDIGIARDKLMGIIEHARIFDSREANSGMASRAAVIDDSISILEDAGYDGVGRELAQLIRDLNVDEQVSLVALTWIGRGTYSSREWTEAVSRARHAHNNHTAEYLRSLPLLADYIENGLAELDSLAAAEGARQFTA